MRRGALGILLIGAAACGGGSWPPLPPPPPDRVYALSEVDERPEIVLAPPLRYPDDPRLAETEGVVVVRVVIDSAGNPEPATARVVDATDSALAGPARALVLKTLFRPARVRGHVVQVVVDIPVEFSRAALPPVSLHIAGDVYDLPDVEQRPQLVSAPRLAYPAPLLLSGVEGRVVVEAVVDTTGAVEPGSVRVVESGDARFNAAATAYVRELRYTPARVAGRAVRVRMQVPVEFRLPRPH